MNSTKQTNTSVHAHTHLHAKIKNTHWNNQIAVATSGPSEYSATQFIKQMTFKMDEKEERKTSVMRDEAISLQNNRDKER